MSIDAKRCRAVFQKLERDLSKLSLKPDAKNVHGFRTGTRRLQVLFVELSPKLDRSQKKLLKMLGRIRKRAGKVRDLDVQLAALRSLKVAHEAKRKTQLVNSLIELRARQERKLRKTVDQQTAREIRRRLRRASKDFDPQTNLDPLQVAEGMLEAIQIEQKPITEALLHQFRILSKRARYTAEFADPSTGEHDAGVHRFIADIKRIQDAVGDWHDWFTLSETTGKRVGEARESALAAEVHNVTGAKFRRAVSVLTQIKAKAGPSRNQPVQSLVPAVAKVTASAA
jgi:CHAD domain-containing protein